MAENTSDEREFVAEETVQSVVRLQTLQVGAPEQSPEQSVEEYKFIAEDSAQAAARLQTLQVAFIAVESLLLGGGVSSISQFYDPSGPALIQVLFVTSVLAVSYIGIRVSRGWKRLTLTYYQLLDGRAAKLKEIESREGFPYSTKLYSHAATENTNPLTGSRGRSDIGRSLPNLFIALFSLQFLGIAYLLIKVVIQVLGLSITFPNLQYLLQYLLPH